MRIPGASTNYHHRPDSQETDTVQKIWDAVQCVPDDCDVLYIHTKAVTALQPTVGVGGSLGLNLDAWRLAMEHYVLHQWQLCRELLDQHDCVGVDWTQYRQHWWLDDQQRYSVMPRRCRGYFPGNFWWARSRYLRGLDPRHLWEFDVHPEYQEFWNSRPADEKQQRLRYLAEYWIGTNDPKVHSFRVMSDHSRCSWHEDNMLEQIMAPGAQEKISWK